MSTQIKTRRGTAAEHTTFTGAEGELTVNTTNDSVHVHDGSTAGGHELAKADGSNLAMESDLTFGDNDKAIFGAGSDLQIYHNGAHSLIEDQGTGFLYIKTDRLNLQNAAGTENLIQAISDGAVNLYYDNAPKLATTSTGIDVTGTATMDGLTVESASSTVATFTQNDGTNYPRIIISDDTNGMVIQNSFSSGTQRDLTFKRPTGQATLNIDGDTGDISFYEDTGTTASFEWDADATRLVVTGREASRVTSTYALEVDNSAHVSNMDAAGAFNVKGYYGNSFTVSGLGDLKAYDDANNVKFFWDASAESLGIGTSNPVTALDVRGEISVDYNATYGLRFYNQGRNNWSSIGNTDTATGANLVFKSSSGEAMRITPTGDLLVGKTDTNIATDGHTIWNDGRVDHTRDSAYEVMILNKLNNDGNIVTFRKDGTVVGSIGNYGARPYFSSTSCGFRIGGSDIIPSTATGVDSDGVLVLGGHNKRFKDLYLSGGVYLGGTGSANYLDDYEEGTFTPTVGIAPSSGTISTLTGKYTKVGDLVTVYMLITGSAMTISSYARFDGLPFNGTNNASGYYSTNSIASNAGGEAIQAAGTSIYLGASGGSTSLLTVTITYKI